MAANATTAINKESSRSGSERAISVAPVKGVVYNTGG